MLPFDAFADLIIGAREEQQDAVRLVALPGSGATDALLLVVADGMGGHVGGAMASQLAIDAFVSAMVGSGGAETGEALNFALQAANAAIADAIERQPQLRGMGCTLVAAVLSGRQVQWISVGDTILAEISAGRFSRLNADHSFAPLLDAQAQRGEITLIEARQSDQRHVLRSALTGGRIALVDENGCGLAAGGLLVAASDGIHTLDDDKIAEIAECAAGPEKFVLQVLAEIGHDMPADQDNTTIASARIAGEKTRRIPEVNPQKRRNIFNLYIMFFGIFLLVSLFSLLIFYP